jgi:hypothetical protein
MHENDPEPCATFAWSVNRTSETSLSCFRMPERGILVALLDLVTRVRCEFL